MKLKGKVIVTEKYNGKSKFEFWNKLDIGDILEFRISINAPGSNRGQLYATQVYVKNLTSGMKFNDSLTLMTNYLSKIGYQEQS